MGRLAVLQDANPKSQCLRGGLGPTGLRHCPWYGPLHPHAALVAPRTDKPPRPPVLLVALHMSSRLVREGIHSPTKITVIVFFANSPQRALFSPCAAPLACNAASYGPGHSEEQPVVRWLQVPPSDRVAAQLRLFQHSTRARRADR